MTENLLQKLEERIVCLLEELEDLHAEVSQLKHSNYALQAEKTASQEKLQNLLTLLDTFDLPAPDTNDYRDQKDYLVESEGYMEAVPA